MAAWRAFQQKALNLANLSASYLDAADDLMSNENAHLFVVGRAWERTHCCRSGTFLASGAFRSGRPLIANLLLTRFRPHPESCPPVVGLVSARRERSGCSRHPLSMAYLPSTQFTPGVSTVGGARRRVRADLCCSACRDDRYSGVTGPGPGERPPEASE